MIHGYEIKIDQDPIAYARERFVHGHCYNPKGKEMRAYTKLLKEHMDDYLKELVKDPSRKYYVELEFTFNIRIPKSASKKKTKSMLAGEIKPDTRPDLDNYFKFIIDSMHNVFYDDDKRVTDIIGRKRYAEEGSTILKVTIVEAE